MHPHRRRKKRPNYGIRTVEVERGPNGFGFTISGQQPCILSCIVANSPADQAGLRAGDFLISVNGLSVSKITHDAVVKLIGNSIGPIKMSIAEYYYSDSSDEELDAGRVVSSRKPKYMHKPRTQRGHKGEINVGDVGKGKDGSPKKSPKEARKKFEEGPGGAPIQQIQERESSPIEYKALVGYLGTIEMPKQLLPSSRLQTVCSCIRKLRQEKRAPSAVLMTVLPSCLSLKNSNNQILAIFPASRVVYISSSSDKDSRYFGLVTSAICENQSRYLWNYSENPKIVEKTLESLEIEISNSCHVFVTDPKLIDHNSHVKKAESFKISCTPDIITGHCLEFPKNSLYVVSLVQNMYRLQDSTGEHQKSNHLRLNNIEEHLGPLVANSPQPSASSNSDSGIGFRDDCGNISDRILVVEFPAQRPIPVMAPNSHRPCAIDGSNIPLDSFDLSSASSQYSINNVRAKPNLPPNLLNNQLNNLQYNLAPSGLQFGLHSNLQQNFSVNHHHQPNLHGNLQSAMQIGMQPNPMGRKAAEPQENCYEVLKSKKYREGLLNNVRACDDKPPDPTPPDPPKSRDLGGDSKKKPPGNEWTNRLTVRAMPDPIGVGVGITRSISPLEEPCRTADIDTGQIFSERPIDVPEPPHIDEEISSLRSSADNINVDNVSVHSSRSFDLNTIKAVFKTPGPGVGVGVGKCADGKRGQGQGGKRVVKHSDDSLLSYKLSPKVYGVSKPNYSCEELSILGEGEKCGFGSLQDLCSWTVQDSNRRTAAVSEPDVRMQRDECGSLDQIMVAARVVPNYSRQYHKCSM